MSTNQPANYPPSDAPHWDPPPPGAAANFPPQPNQYRPQIQYNHQPYPLPPPYQYNQPPITNHHRPNPPAFTAAFWQADGRKRKFKHYPNRRPPLASCESFAKLYVSQVSRTSTEEDIHSVFGQHGKILEVILMKDKRTGQQQGTCFVKFATVGDAEVAIGALHNQYTFPGETESLKVKFADGEQERLGLDGASSFRKPYLGETEPVRLSEKNQKDIHIPDLPGMHGVKLYIKNFSRHASKKEIEEVFSKYGEVEDVHILLDDLRHSRGMGFIKFSDRYMAEAAINALNGTYIMEDCEYPLIVRFADAKKPQNDLRFNLPQTHGITGGQAFARNVQQGPAINYGAPVQANPTNLLPQAFPPASYKQLQPTAASVLHCGFHPLQQSPTLIPAAACYTDKPLRESYQPHPQIADMHPKDNELPRQLTEVDQVTPHRKSEDQIMSQRQNEDLASVQQQGEFQSVLPQQNTDHCLPEQASGASSKLQEVDIATDGSSLTTSSLDAISSLDCDWSEHFCPDGNKYYYNCETSETRWEKPVEYASFEKHVLELIQSETSYSTSQSLSSQEVLSSH